MWCKEEFVQHKACDSRKPKDKGDHDTIRRPRVFNASPSEGQNDGSGARDYNSVATVCDFFCHSAVHMPKRNGYLHPINLFELITRLALRRLHLEEAE